MPRAMTSEYMQHAGRVIPEGVLRLDYSGLQSEEIRRFVMDALRDDLGDHLRDYRYLRGPLQEALADLGGLPSAACAIFAPGTSMANYLAISAVLQEPGDQVLLEFPTYSLLSEAASNLHADVHYVERPGPTYILDPAAVRDAIRHQHLDRLRLIVLTNLHNPSGACLDEETLRAVGEIAAEHGARVLVDEVYLEAVFDQPVTSAARLGPVFISTGSLTKAYGLGPLRCGWIYCEPGLAGRIENMTDLLYVNPPEVAQRAALVALRLLPEIRERAAAILNANLALLNAFLRSRDDLEVVPRPYGTVAFPRVLSGPVSELIRLLETEEGTTVTDGRFFGAPEHIRVGIGAPTATVEAGLEHLGSALDRLGQLAPSSAC